MVFDSVMCICWGCYEFCLLYNLGKILDYFSVDVFIVELVCVGDNIVGNIVYFFKVDLV